MKHFITGMFVTLALVQTHAGEAYDLGERRSVPDWAVGPLLVVPMERVEDRRLNVPRSETKRIGTIQSHYIEFSGRRYRLASIRLSEIPNDGYGCDIKTVPEAGRYFAIGLSQDLFDQTFYYICIQTMDAATQKPIKEEQFAVWDAKSRK